MEIADLLLLIAGVAEKAHQPFLEIFCSTLFHIDSLNRSIKRNSGWRGIVKVHSSQVTVRKKITEKPCNDIGKQLET